MCIASAKAAASATRFCKMYLHFCVFFFQNSPPSRLTLLTLPLPIRGRGFDELARPGKERRFDRRRQTARRSIDFEFRLESSSARRVARARVYPGDIGYQVHKLVPRGTRHRCGRNMSPGAVQSAPRYDAISSSRQSRPVRSDGQTRRKILPYL